MNFDSNAKKYIFKNSLYPNLASFAVHFKFEDGEQMPLLFAMAVFTFIIVYLLMRLLIFIAPLLGKNKLEKNNIYAFDLTIIALFANNIISLAALLANYLFDMDWLFEILAFPFLISLGTTPFFAIMLLMWLLIKAFQYLRSRRRNVNN